MAVRKIVADWLLQWNFSWMVSCCGGGRNIIVQKYCDASYFLAQIESVTFSDVTPCNMIVLQLFCCGGKWKNNASTLPTRSAQCLLMLLSSGQFLSSSRQIFYPIIQAWSVADIVNCGFSLGYEVNTLFTLWYTPSCCRLALYYPFQIKKYTKTSEMNKFRIFEFQVWSKNIRPSLPIFILFNLQLAWLLW